MTRETSAAFRVPFFSNTIFPRTVCVLLLAGLFWPSTPANGQNLKWRAPDPSRSRGSEARAKRGPAIVPPANKRAAADLADDRRATSQPARSAEQARPSEKTIDYRVAPAAFRAPTGEPVPEDPGYEGEEGEIVFDGLNPVFPSDGEVDNGYAGGDYYNDPASDCGHSCHPDYFPIASQLWFRADYLLWWTQGSDVPALVTTSTAGTVQTDAGVLGLSTTSILFGDTAVTDGTRSGGRMTLGYWLQPSRQLGMQVEYLALGSEATRFLSTSQGNPILARPFFNVETGQQQQDASLVAFTGVVDGTVTVDATTELQSVALLLRRPVFQECGRRIDFLVGYRFGRLDDTLRMTESTLATAVVGPPAQGTTIDLFDLFDTRNDFHGAELGVVYQKRRYRWSWELMMKLALGNTHTTVLIDGATTTTLPNGGGTSTGTGGILAQQTNIGTFDQNDFSVVPELGINLSYDLTCRLRATMGYSLLYWSVVGRPGDQIDLHVNPTQFPPGALAGTPEPQFTSQPTDLWAQGLNFGLEYRF